jgi:hypothetical protein
MEEAIVVMNLDAQKVLEEKLINVLNMVEENVVMNQDAPKVL